MGNRLKPNFGILVCVWLNESLYMRAKMSSVHQHRSWDTKQEIIPQMQRAEKKKKCFPKIVMNIYKWPEMKSGPINMGKEYKTMYKKSRKICITIQNDNEIGSKLDSIVERQHGLNSTFFKMTFFPQEMNVDRSDDKSTQIIQAEQSKVIKQNEQKKILNTSNYQCLKKQKFLSFWFVDYILCIYICHSCHL